jgi:segregation and condensation protein A
MARDRLGRDVFARGAPEGLRTVRQTRYDAALYDLLAAYGRISARTRPVMHVVASRDVMTLEEAIARVADQLGTRIDWAALHRFLPAGGSADYRRSALASSFVAALELARQGRVTLRQEGAFAPLYLRAPR